MRRRLTTIVAADVAGFSRLVGLDEEGVLAALRVHRRELVEPLLARHGGRIANTAGDSLLIEFDSAVEAVRFAVALQAGMRERNAAIEPDGRIVFRIGVNIGDVVADGEDLLGDGVNVAARLEQRSPPGGIVLSRAVRDAVRDRLELDLVDLGELAVKNIARPVRAFRVATEGEAPARATPSRGGRARRVAIAASVVAAVLLAVVATAVTLGRSGFAPEPGAEAAMAPSEPAIGSIVVLPFSYSGDGGADGLLGEALAADVSGALSRFADLTVIGQESAAAYGDGAAPLREIARDLRVRHVLKGSVERSGERLRITVGLLDATTGRQVWTDRHDAVGADIFLVRDEIARSVAAQLGETFGALGAATLAQSKRKDTDRLRAYELVLLAAELRHRFDKADNAKALALLERAVELDPQYARAHADMAWTHWQDVINGFSEAPAASFAAARASAETAIRADPYFSDGYWVLGSVTMCESEDTSSAVALFEKAIELNPNHQSLLVEWGGYILPQTLDRASEGVPLVERAIRLNPRHPDWYDGALVSALLFARRPEEAIRAYEAVEFPQFPVRVLLAAAYGHAGQAEGARRAVAEILKIEPALTLSTLEDYPALCPEGASEAAWRYLKEGLRIAGLPD